MKVMLICPYTMHGKNHGTNEYFAKERIKENRDDFIPSAALAFLAGQLRENGHEPIVRDFNSYKTHRQLDPMQYSKEVIIDTIAQHEPALVGLNCLFSGVFPVVRELVTMIKQSFPNIKTVIGGIHPTTYPKEILENTDELDYIVVGEGETILVELASYIEGRSGIDVTEIQSLAYRDVNGSVRVNSRQTYIDDLDEIPTPAWDLFDFEDYKCDLSHYYNPKQHEIMMRAPIFTSRACPFSCNFCNMNAVMGKKFRRRSPKAIVDEMEFLNRTFGVNYYSFLDDNLTLHKGHILSLCEEIKNRGLDIQFDTPNGVDLNALDEEVVAALADTGLVMTSLAIEHGSDYIRNEVVGKHLSREKIFEIISLCKKYKIRTNGFFIIGFPEETYDTLKEQYEFMSQLEIDRKSLLTLIPFPGTKVFQQAVDDNLFSVKVDLANLWQAPMSHAQSEFVIAPYNLPIEKLVEFKSSFNLKSRRFERLPEDLFVSN